MKRWALIFVLAFLFTGCTKEVPAKLQCSTVVRIDVEGYSGTCVLESQEGMGSVLGGLRQLQNIGRAQEDPEALSAEAYRIHLYLSDGRQVRYYFRSDGYLSKNETAWQKLELRSAHRFLRLLRILTA